jgi:DNA modification methylase
LKAAVSTKSHVNKLAAADAPGHEWYRFVLSYPPHLVRDYVDRFGCNRESQVLDPFGGTGTTLVECKKLGVPAIGVEAHPMAHFAATTKVDWSPDPDELESRAQQIAGEASGEISEQAPLRTLPEKTVDLLLANSISPLPLHKTLILLETIARHGDGCHERLALAKALVTNIGNLRFGPEVGIGPAKEDAPVVQSWLTNVRAMAADLRKLQSLRRTSSTVHHADSRQAVALIQPGSIDAVITSPPYPNEKDYTRTTRLESVILGFLKNKHDLKSLKATLMRSNTRNVFKGDDDDQWVAAHPEIQRLAAAIETRRLELGKTSGFERMYPRVTRLYFGGMARHLEQLKSVLKPGAHLAYVVGDQASYLRIMIRTGQLLADIAQRLGYRVEGIDLFRTRRATATGEQLREEVVVLKWPGR